MVLVDQEIMDLLDRINQVLGRLEGATFEDKLHRSTSETLLFYHALRKTFMLLRQIGLPDNMNQMFVAIQRAIMLLNQMRLAIIAVQTAMIPGAGWIAGLMAVASVGMVAAHVGESLAYEQRGI